MTFDHYDKLNFRTRFFFHYVDVRQVLEFLKYRQILFFVVEVSKVQIEYEMTGKFRFRVCDFILLTKGGVES